MVLFDRFYMFLMVLYGFAEVLKVMASLEWFGASNAKEL